MEVQASCYRLSNFKILKCSKCLHILALLYYKTCGMTCVAAMKVPQQDRDEREAGGAGSKFLIPEGTVELLCESDRTFSAVTSYLNAPQIGYIGIVHWLQ